MTPVVSHTCSVTGCDATYKCSGYCAKHYQRLRNTGSLELAKRTPEERFWSKVDKQGPPPALRPELGPCWLWTAAKSVSGYGRFGTAALSGGGQAAHRASWRMAHGPIPEGLHIDHLCRVHNCVNPAHLEPVTPKVNSQRGIAADFCRARAFVATHCRNGHEYTPENTSISEGFRQCRVCKAANSLRSNERRRGRDRSRDIERCRRRRQEQRERDCQEAHRPTPTPIPIKEN